MAIDTQKIIQAIMEGSKYRDAKGIIPIFGVYLSLFSVDYYNKLSFEFELMMEPSRQTKAEQLLIDAAQECGYATFHGIRTSKEWEKIVQPMIETQEDELQGFISVAIGLGWGNIELVKLVPGENLVLRATESYEADGYISRHGLSKSGKCYMLRGVSAAFMDLIYGDSYPEGYNTFTAIEPKCRAKGDDFCEFVVQKSHKKEYTC